MKNKILSLLVLAVICLGVFHPAWVYAVTPLEPDAQASLTLHYQKDGIAFEGLEIGIYRVAEAFPDGSYALIRPFSSYPVNIHDITMQAQWQNIARTLDSYVVANQVIPDRDGRTDENGSVSFSELKTGLYFVREVVAENAGGTYIFNRFLVYVPAPQPDGTYLYDVEANPKCTDFVPKSQYSVTKLWQDAGNQSSRPETVTVDIYKDGVQYETITLGADNNWTYTWSVPGGDTGSWTVVERSVPDVYKVLIQQNNSSFSIINTYETTPDTPQTGDSFTLLPWILVMCFSGIMLLILGLYGRRQG